MYRTTIEAGAAGIVIRREHSTNPEVVPYKLADEAAFPDEEKAFRLLEASDMTVSVAENGVAEFRQK
jgi:hypothetical protein